MYVLRQHRISHDNKLSQELLYLYGFVVEDNPDDYLMVRSFMVAVKLL